MRSSSSCVGVARRGWRYLAGAPTVAVDASHRLRCASRSALARRNSLHSLRSLRSANRRGSEHVARAARVPSALLRCSPRHKSPPPGTAHRAETLVVFVDAVFGSAGKAGGGCAPAATLRGAEERRGARVARRPEATRRPHTVRAPSAAALRSSVAPARGRVCVAALAARAPQGSRSEAEAAASGATPHTHPRLRTLERWQETLPQAQLERDHRPQLARHHRLQQQVKVVIGGLALVARQHAAGDHDRRDALLEHAAQRTDRLDAGVA